MKELVNLRERKLKEGTVLYLDYTLDGCRVRENLHLYITKDKQANKNAYEVANLIKAKKILEIQQGLAGIKRKKVDIFSYFINCKKNWTPVRYRLKDYLHTDSISIDKVDLQGFINYLNNTSLKGSTRYFYARVVVTVFRRAYKEGYLAKLPTVCMPKESAYNRAYLTEKELSKLSSTPCRNEEVKRAFLFSCLTGLRYSDIVQLKRENISVENGYTRLTFTQKKTGKIEYLDICSQAAQLLNNTPFSITYTMTSRVLTDWAKKAEISKRVTFHVARHTFATILLNKGVDIFTVSKLLGHSKLSTTQIYAKLVDSSKRSAVNLLNGLISRKL